MERAADLPSELTLHAASLRRVARALVRDEAGAEDLLQEAHLARLQRPDAAVGSLVGWFRGTLRRMASGEHRGRTRAALREASVARSEALESAAERSEALELQERLVALVRALPEPQAEVLWLRFWEDLAPREIAARLEISPAAAKSRLRRALDALRERMDATSAGGREEWLGVLVPWLSTVPKPAALGAALPLVFMGKLLAGAVTLGLLLLAYLELGGGGVQAEPLTVEVADPAGPPRDSAGGTMEVASLEPSNREPRMALAQDVKSASLRVRVLRQVDGSPMAGVEVACIDKDRLKLESIGVKGVTDEDGLVSFVGLRLGNRVELRTNQGAMSFLTLEESQTELSIEVPAGGWVRGRVLDPKGRPVEGARVCIRDLNGMFRWISEMSGTTTDKEGRFELVDLPRNAALIGRHEDFAPSFIETLADYDLSSDVALELEFVLHTPGHPYSGVVVDSEGLPVVGAWIKVSGLDDFQRVKGRLRTTARETLTRTDSNGKFHVGELGDSNLRVRIAASSYAPLSHMVFRRDGRSSLTEFVLLPECRVNGTVFDAEGNPLADVHVSADEMAGENLGVFSPFLPERTRTNAEGHFELKGLAAGVVRVGASVPSEPRLLASATLVPGEVVRMDFRAEGGPALKGRVLDGQGEPVVGAMVRVRGRGSYFLAVGTDAEGRFALRGAPQGPLDLEIFPLARNAPTLEVFGVVEGDWPMELVWSQDDYRASIAGSFHDAAGLLDLSLLVEVYIERLDGAAYKVMDLGSGQQVREESRPWRFDGLAAGVYRVRLKIRKNDVWSGQPFDLAKGQALVLPKFETQAGASVRLKLVYSGDPKSVQGTLIQGGTELKHVKSAVDGELLFECLESGPWALLVTGNGFAATRHELELFPGQAWSSTQHLEEIPVVELHLLSSPEEPVPSILKLWIRDDAGRLLQQTTKGGGRPIWFVWHPPGTYTIECLGESEHWSASGSFVVPEVPTDEPVAVHLKVR